MSTQQQFRALVLGCTGVAGSALVSRLIADSEKNSTWAEIVGLSRGGGGATRLEVTKRSKTSSFVVRFLSADLQTDDPQTLAGQIGNDILSRITHVFFCVWIPVPQSPDEEYKTNCKILDNFLNATVLVRRKAQNASDVEFPRMILLEGTKSYGIHLGPAKFTDYRAPFDEDKYSRHSSPANFYFGWEDSLKKRQWPEWVVMRPGPIVGVSVQRSSFFNFGTGFAVFLCLLKSLNRTLIFPNTSDGADKTKALDALHDSVDSKIVAYEMAWLGTLASSTLKSNEMLDACGIPAINCSNGEPFKWKDLWPKLAQRLSMKYSLDDSFDMLKFINSPEVVAHWAKLVEQHSLITPKNLGDVAVWPAILATLTRPFDCHASVQKIRRLGFSKTANSLDMFVSVISDLQKNNVIPPVLIS